MPSPTVRARQPVHGVTRTPAAGPVRGTLYRKRDVDYSCGPSAQRYLSLVDTELPSSEQVLWSDSPARYPLLDRQDAFLIPFSILWFVWGLVFVAIDLCMTVGRLFVRQVMLRRVGNTNTNRRIIIRGTGQREESRYLSHPEPQARSVRDIILTARS